MAENSRPESVKVKKASGFECPVCQKRFNRSVLLARHSLVHTGKRDFMCQVCDKTFFSKYHLNRHVEETHQLHLDSTKAKHECKECGKKFTRPENLRKHSHAPLKEGKYSCAICDKKYTQKSGLNRHMTVHEEKKFKCNICGKMFARSSVLSEHAITHSAIKDFECEECGKTFSLEKYLDKHMLTHSQVKNFSCSVCFKRFLLKSDLNRHMFIHGENSFPCDICGFKFRQNNNKNVHLNHCKKAHTEVESENAPLTAEHGEFTKTVVHDLASLS